jgi:hypothetical protein
MNEQQLQELALQTQQLPLGTTTRRINLSKLIDGIYRSGKLCHPYKGQFFGIYEQIYQEAIQDLFLYICKNLHKYDPERASFMTWVNMLLSQRFFKEAIPKIMGKANEIRIENSILENMEDSTFNNSQEEGNYFFAFEKIKRHIEIDPKGIFKQAHIKKYPQVNFREIAVKRWSGVPWKDISKELNIPVATLSSFYQRTLETLREELKDLCGIEDLT